MSHAARTSKTTVESLPADIAELVGALAQLPTAERQRIEPLIARVLDSSKRRRRILGLVQDALTQLRLDMKYLMFDLEATRRERDEFKRKVEEA